MDRAAFGSEAGWKAAEAQEKGRAFVASLKPGLRKHARMEFVGETVEVHFEKGANSVSVRVQPDGAYAWRTGSGEASGEGTVAEGATTALVDAVRDLVTEF